MSEIAKLVVPGIILFLLLLAPAINGWTLYHSIVTTIILGAGAALFMARRGST